MSSQKPLSLAILLAEKTSSERTFEWGHTESLFMRSDQSITLLSKGIGPIGIIPLLRKGELDRSSVHPL
jgi:hypothetical protein